MQKIRDLYKETQGNARKDFEKVTQQRMKKVLAFCNKQFNNILNKNDYTDLDQITFYREKFQNIVEIFAVSRKQNLKKTQIQEQIIEIVKDQYVSQVQTRAQQVQLPIIPPNSQESANNREIKTSEAASSLIQTFFDNKKEEIQRSKIGFRSVLQEIPYAPKKFAIKSSEMKKVSQADHPDRTEQIKELQIEIARLKRELSVKQNERQMNMQMIQREKKEYENRINELNRELNELEHENTRLKEESVRNYPIRQDQHIIIHKEIRHYQEEEEQGYRPYHTKYRQNDINKIKSKGATEPIFFKPPTQDPLKTYLSPKMTPYQYIIKQPALPLSKKPYQSVEDMQPTNNLLQINKKHSDSMINVSSHKSVNTKSRDDARSIALKSKVSFFKPSMIIYRCEDFQIAVKSVDVIKLQLKRINIYVNNKSHMQKQVSLDYTYDRNYYDIKVSKKLTEIEPRNQAREQVEVKFINSADLDSLIQVRISIDAKELDFLLPAMFIEFLQKRPVLDRSVRYSSKLVNPIHQFADLSSAAELLPLEKIYGQLYESGRVYAISKHHEGYITFRWVGGKVQVETIPPLKLFICYLLLKEY